MSFAGKRAALHTRDAVLLWPSPRPLRFNFGRAGASGPSHRPAPELPSPRAHSHYNNDGRQRPGAGRDGVNRRGKPTAPVHNRCWRVPAPRRPREGCWNLGTRRARAGAGRLEASPVVADGKVKFSGVVINSQGPGRG